MQMREWGGTGYNCSGNVPTAPQHYLNDMQMRDWDWNDGSYNRCMPPMPRNDGNFF